MLSGKQKRYLRGLASCDKTIFQIGKDALIENCIIMPDVEIADGAHLKNVIVDKHSRIAKKKDLAGLEEQPLYIGRRENV